ncbi:MAG: acetamidase [Streptosporangiales bacterium]|nr:acetamidase [Streptosporangiales bacterium]
MASHEVRIDSSRPLAQQPETGHNRWHPDIPAVVGCREGDEVVLETRDALDGQVGPQTAVQQVGGADLSVVHPLTGPVHVEGAEPGDLLIVEILDIEPDSYGFTVQIPGFGFLRDVFPDPHKIDWRIADGWATSPDLSGVRIPGAPFMGTIGVAPSRDLMARATAREQAAADGGGLALPPSAEGAVPAGGPITAEALRTVPPRENGGNVDIKQLVRGTRLLLPVYVPGALFSAGDAHFAQGDCETCGTAIEMRARLHVRFSVRKGEGSRLRGPRFERDDYFVSPEYAAPRRFLATTGIPVGPDDENRAEDLTLAARNALLAMIELLGERGYSRQQAYALCSVAVDLKISQVVDAPNPLVSAFLSLDIFT